MPETASLKMPLRPFYERVGISWKSPTVAHTGNPTNPMEVSDLEWGAFPTGGSVCATRERILEWLSACVLPPMWLYTASVAMGKRFEPRKPGDTSTEITPFVQVILVMFPVLTFACIVFLFLYTNLEMAIPMSIVLAYSGTISAVVFLTHHMNEHMPSTKQQKIQQWLPRALFCTACQLLCISSSIHHPTESIHTKLLPDVHTMPV